MTNQEIIDLLIDSVDVTRPEFIKLVETLIANECPFNHDESDNTVACNTIVEDISYKFNGCFSEQVENIEKTLSKRLLAYYVIQSQLQYERLEQLITHTLVSIIDPDFDEHEKEAMEAIKAQPYIKPASSDIN